MPIGLWLSKMQLGRNIGPYIPIGGRMANTAAERMQCMEVWGGNQPVDRGVVMAGLDAWVYSRPYGDATVGGDVHYVSSCATGRINRLLVADVSGHGAVVSETAVRLRGLMRRFVNYLDQSRFVEEMNNEFTALSQAGRFATAVVMTVFAPTNDLTICNAGHPPPLYYSAARKKWSYLEPGGQTESGAANFPLGIVDRTNYEQFGVRLAVGDLVMCYTDALIEASDAEGGMLGRAGLLDVVQTIDVSDPALLIVRLLEAIQTRLGRPMTEDDLTILLFRPNGLGERPSFLMRAMAPLRILGKAIGSLRSGADPAPWPEISMPNIGGAMFGPLNRLWSRRNDAKAPAAKP